MLSLVEISDIEAYVKYRKRASPLVTKKGISTKKS